MAGSGIAESSVGWNGGSKSGSRRRVNPQGPLTPRSLLLLFVLFLASATDRGLAFVRTCTGQRSFTTNRAASSFDGHGHGRRRRQHGAGVTTTLQGRRERVAIALVVGWAAKERGGRAWDSLRMSPARGHAMPCAVGMPLGGKNGEKIVTARASVAYPMTLSWSIETPTVAYTAFSCSASRSSTAAAAAAAPGDAGMPKDVLHEENGEGKGYQGVPTAAELLVKARNLYHDKFGRPEDVKHVSAGYAPGRVNLIGEHTDYNGGFVMPLALERGTVVYGVGRLVESDEAAAAVAEGSSGEGLCGVVSETMLLAEERGMGRGSGSNEAGEVWFRADESLGPGEPEWANYVKGVVKEFMPKVPEGKRLEFTAMIVGTVPIGGGVSSSASLSVAMGTFLQGVLSSAGLSVPSPKEKAHLCRMAEHNFLDMPCGIMDQFVTSMAVRGHAMLLDCRSEEVDPVPLSNPDLVIVVTNSNIKHKLAGSQYPVRVAQCTAARDELKKSHPNVELLRDATPEQVEEIEGSVDDVVFRRARHVVSENARTVAAAEALKDGDYLAVGGLMWESHRSLREDYEVSCAELDVLVDLASEVEGVFGSRLTGAGFGGCTVTLVEKDAVGNLVKHLREGYSRTVGRECSSFVTKPGHGARGLVGAAAASAGAWPE